MAEDDRLLELAKQLENVSVSTLENSAVRGRLLTAARNVVRALDSKPEIDMLNLAKAPVAHAVLRTALKINLFEKFGSDGSKTVNELSEQCGAEPDLLIRLLRTLASLGIFTQINEETFAHTIYSEKLANPQIRAIVRGMSETAMTFFSLPDFLQSIDYCNPTDQKATLFGFDHKTDLTMFEWLETQPEQRAIFAEFQSATSEISDLRLQPLLLSILTSVEAGASGVQFVDVGGGRGRTLREFCKTHAADIKGRVILQDLPKVVEGLDAAVDADHRKPGDVEVIPFNFFDRQPIQGAAVYFFRHILHNWPDASCQQILRNTISAMDRASSQIIIVDMVLPDKHTPDQYMTMIDISMMSFGGMERTEAEWRRLLESVGLQVSSIESVDPSSPSSDSVITTRLATLD